MSGKQPVSQSQLYTVSLNAGNATPLTALGSFKIPCAQGGIFLKGIHATCDVLSPTSLAVYIVSGDPGAIASGDQVVPDVYAYSSYEQALVGFAVLSGGADPANGGAGAIYTPVTYSFSLDALISPLNGDEYLTFIVVNSDGSNTLSLGRQVKFRVHISA